nr:hypothetical protein HJG59_009500 [Molossus molossus]
MYLAVLLQRPEGALGEELQPRQPLEPRAAYWLSSFGLFNKYLEKLFNSKSKDTKKDVKNPKKTENSTKAPPANATKPLPSKPAEFPLRNSTNPPPRAAARSRPPTSS